MAREAVRKSLVLLKNDGDCAAAFEGLGQRLIIAGAAADDIGSAMRRLVNFLAGRGRRDHRGRDHSRWFLRSAASETTAICYSADGNFAAGCRADAGIVVLHEDPYAEGFGDRADLSLSAAGLCLGRACAPALRQADRDPDRRAAARCHRAIAAGGCLMSWLGCRAPRAMAWVMSCLAIIPSAGTLPFTWPRSMNQIPLSKLNSSDEEQLWEIGAGIRT